MLYEVLVKSIPEWTVLLTGACLGFFLTLILLRKPFGFLPVDGGKRVETPDGKIIVINDKSNGKVTGVGLVFVLIFLLMGFLFVPVSVEMLIYLGLMFLMMLTGYLDDASANPWGELTKGILDLMLAIGAVVTFLCYHSPDVILFGNSIHFPVVVYGILGVALVWASINVTNCSDGVDGLCGSVSIITFVAYFILFRETTMSFTWLGIILSAILLGYLFYNWNPSKVLMGDAGSRTIGFLLAILAMESRHPFIFLLMSLVFIFDGGMGLIKVSLIRFFKLNLFKNVTFPFHDHMRKKMGISIKKIVVIFDIIQVVACGIAMLIVELG